MNFACLCAQITEAPHEAYTGPTQSVVKCVVTLPPLSDRKAPTVMEYSVTARAAKEKLAALPVNALLYIHGATLRHDLENRVHSITGGNVAQVTESFPIFNDVILSGRCIKDVTRDGDRPMFKVTDSGLTICEQSLSVNTGKGSADLFNLVAFNGVDDRFRPAELLASFTRKGVGLTISGRISTDAWKDKNTQEQRSKTVITVNKLTLAPKGQPAEKPIEPSTTVSNDEPAQLWGGRTATTYDSPHQDAISQGLPDIPMPF
jgi:single-stranded DNA-binding protein